MWFEYRIVVRDSEISKKFKFSVDTLWRIREDLEYFPTEEKRIIGIECLNVFKRGVKYPYERRFRKQFDHEFKYGFAIKKKNENIILIPTAIFYDRNLATKEKLSILWYFSLKEKFDRPPEVKEIEKASGISDKTIRKALKKYPKLSDM